MRTYITGSEQETQACGAMLAGELSAPAVVALSGGLGAGKTAFVRGMASVLAPGAHVSSPTYALVHEYGGKPPLVHFDMYRIAGWADLESTGYYDYLASGAVLAVEWSENIAAALPEGTVYVTIEDLGAGKRRILIGEAPV